MPDLSIGAVMFRALILCLMLAGCAYTGSKTATVGCQAFDTWTTVRGLEVGATEGNPLLGDSRSEIIARKGLITALLILLHHYWKGDDKSRDAGFTAVNVITCGAAVHNLGVIHRQKRINSQ